MLPRRRDIVAGFVAGAALALGRAGRRAEAADFAALGTTLTPFGAIREGSRDGLLPAYGGAWLAPPADVGADPYAGEKPVFSIDSRNLEKHAARLSEGQKALLQRYPQSFRMDIYPGHRDFRFADAILTNLRLNARSAALTPDGEGVTGVFGAPAFPLPKSGLEAIWNAITIARPVTARGTMDEAVVYPDGKIAWGAQKWDIYCPSYDPAIGRERFDGTSVVLYRTTTKPDREAGTIALAREYWDFGRRPTQAWAYVPGTRRVKQVAEIAGDYPIGPGGFHTVDDTGLWAQSPRRYDWELLGRREIFIPYHNNRLDDPGLPYKTLLGKAHLNPDLTRWELHRCWVLKARIKPGIRHIYGARTLYLDEDSLIPVLSDLHDMQGRLYRVAVNTSVYDPVAQLYAPRLCVYHDLDSGAYMVDRLTNEVADRMRVNEGGRSLSDYTPQQLQRKAV